LLQQLAGVLHLGARGGVDLDEIDKAALVDLRARTAGTAGRRTDPGFAVQRLGEDARNGGLADTAGAGEEIGMVQAIVIEGVHQRLLHVVLPDQFSEIARAPLARQDLVAHLTNMPCYLPRTSWS
jgi:hypothetical protein